MELEALRDLCLAFPETSEDFPFDENTLAFRVSGKIFALTGVDQIPPRVNLKCDPLRALELRATYACVEPGYHMNKKHWNTIVLDGSASQAEVEAWVAHSYDLVVAGLPRAQRDHIARVRAATT